MPAAAAIDRLDCVAGDSLDNRVDETLTMLRAAAIEHGMVVTGDDRIAEANAAALIGLECETLAKKRSEGKAPPSYRVPIGAAKVSYRLCDLARWIEQGREDF
jgi:hypothetical protein